MLIVGGTATLYGGFVGAALFILVQDRRASINPVYWLFWLGILLILSRRPASPKARATSCSRYSTRCRPRTRVRPIDGTSGVVQARCARGRSRIELGAAISSMVTSEGQALILMEQNVERALSLTHRAIVLERGRIVHEGSSAVLRENPHALDRWIGVRVAG